MLKKSLSVMLAAAMIVLAFPFVKMEVKAAPVTITLDPGHGNYNGSSAAEQFGGKMEDFYNLDIAEACKARLEELGATVYMTRTSDYVNPGYSDRALTAANNGSSAFISIHNNESDKSYVYGSQIYMVNPSYNYDMHVETTKMADLIMKHLNEDAGTNKWSDPYYVNSQSGNTYSDGSISDYYAVLRYSKLYSKGKRAGSNLMAAMIVECVFQSNESDVKNFLEVPEKITAMGVAIADGIAEHYGLSDPVGTVNDFISGIVTGPEQVKVLANTENNTVKTVMQGAQVKLSGWSMNEAGVESFQWRSDGKSFVNMDKYYLDTSVNTDNPTYSQTSTANYFEQVVDTSDFPVGQTTYVYLQATATNGAKYQFSVIVFKIIAPTLTSSDANHEIDRTQAEPVIRGFDLKTDNSVLREMLSANTEGMKLAIIGNDGLENAGCIGTGNVVKLIADGVVVDEITVIVKSDLDGDGVATSKDILMAKLNTASTETSAILNEAADLDGDGAVSSEDLKNITYNIANN